MYPSDKDVTGSAPTAAGLAGVEDGHWQPYLAGFKVLDRLQNGPNRELYLAHDLEADRPVVLTVLPARFGQDTEVGEEFLARGQSLSRQEHRNVARVFAAGRDESGRLYVATEFVQGKPLSERMAQLARQKSPVYAVYALRVVRQVAVALAVGEGLGLSHQDLRPESVVLRNVTLKADDSVVLLGLELPAAIGNGRLHRGRTGDEYTAPEQLAGRRPDQGSNIYSVGAILYSILAGAAPEGPVSRWQAAVSRWRRKRSGLARRRDDLAPETLRLAERCLARNPGRRYLTIAQLIAAIDGAIAAENAIALVDDRGGTAARRPSWWTVMAALLVGVLLLLSAGLWALRASDSPGAVAGGSFTPTVAAVGAGEETGNAAAVVAVATAAPTATVKALPTQAATEVGVTEAANSALPAVTATASVESEPRNEPTSEPTATVRATATEEPMVRITFSSVNLRSGPGVEYPTLGYLAQGDSVRVLATNSAAGTWYLVSMPGGLQGWLSASVAVPANGAAGSGLPLAATIPAPPTPTPTPPPTPTEASSLSPEATSQSSGGGASSGSKPQPTLTPPPLP